MKTIAIAAVLTMLTASAWADEEANTQTNEPVNANEPIVLSAVDMDGVTAGTTTIYLVNGIKLQGQIDSFDQYSTTNTLRFVW